LGEAPIANVIGLLEDRFFHVFEIDAPSEKFDGISAKAYDQERKVKAAAVVTRRGLPGERQRLNLTHELGHLVMDVAENVDEEKAAFRFAGAFLAPASLLLREVGTKRSSIQLKELLILKSRFGISIQALLFRLHDLGVINDATYKWSCIQINKLGFRKKEPEPLPPEEPQWLKQNALRAVAEGLMTKEEAERLAGESIEEEREFMDRRAFMKMPLDQRRKILQEQATALKNHYDGLAEGEDLGGGDILDY
jgi:Zn-dependent peptidase ImmA (M78 family)